MKNWEREYENWRDEPHVGGEKPADPNPKCTHNRRHSCEDCSYFFSEEPGERPACHNDEEWEG